MVPLTTLSLSAKVSHQLIANIEMINAEKAKTSKAIEEAQGYKAKVSHLLTEVGCLQEMLQREERTSADLRMALTLEERRKEVKANSIEKKRRAAEEVVSSFKSLEG
ncbi:hypothetical protein COCNU_scaffold054120G000010 [Cocos nucifera]|nr:hypothetical protein [Cocos nucifera]